MKKEYAFHPIAGIFPLMTGGEFAAQVEDVRARGLQEPIVLYEGMILDGRNRYRACVEAGIEPRFREMLFNCYADAVAYVIAANILRRHLTAKQRSDLIEKLLKRKPEQSDRQIAATIKASPTTVGKKRKGLERKGEVSTLDTRTDRKGHSRPAHPAPKADEVSNMDTSTTTLAEPSDSSEPTAGTPTEPNPKPGSKPPRTRRSKQQIRHQQADQSASKLCTSIVAALDASDDGFADAIVGCLCTNHIETLVEIAQHAKFAPIIAAVTAKLGIGMKLIGLQSEVEELGAERDQLRAELACAAPK